MVEALRSRCEPVMPCLILRLCIRVVRISAVSPHQEGRWCDSVPCLWKTASTSCHTRIFSFSPVACMAHCALSWMLGQGPPFPAIGLTWKE